MNTEFIPYEQALELKELGFDEPCFGYYTHKNELKPIKQLKDEFNSLKNSEVNTTYCSSVTPTFSQAFRWFREKYKIGTWIHHYFDMDKGNFQYSWIITLPYKDDGYVYETYEEAELACLTKLIEIVKQEKL